MESDRLVLSLAVLMTIITIIALGNPTITGYVPTKTFRQNLDLDISESQRFTLRATNGTLKLSSFSIGGRTEGMGPVNIYLTDGETRLLIYTNLRKSQSPMKHITGLAVSDLVLEPGATLDVRENVPEEYLAEEGNFENACMQTCLLDQRLQNKAELYLDAHVTGANVHLSEISYTTE